MSDDGAPRRDLLPLLREVGALKRITSAARPGSIAERAFAQAWGALVAGRDATDVALDATAQVLAATRLGDLDATALQELGLSDEEAVGVQRAALAEVALALPPSLTARLHRSVDRASRPGENERNAPPFVAALATQPRAGVTCPGKPRIVLRPAESHAEHCLVVAAYGVILAEPGADLATVFLAGLAHHLHNAAMPDSGFAGEMLLGSYLEPIMARATERALAELPEPLRRRVVAAREILPDARTPEGRAFHAADVLDRVLEIEQHLAAARLTMDVVLSDMALVHDGPVKPFHDSVLAEMGLL